MGVVKAVGATGAAIRVAGSTAVGIAGGAAIETTSSTAVGIANRIGGAASGGVEAVAEKKVEAVGAVC